MKGCVKCIGAAREQMIERAPRIRIPTLPQTIYQPEGGEGLSGVAMTTHGFFLALAHVYRVAWLKRRAK